jgi:hypothetical protein
MKNETIALDPGAVARVLCGNVTGRNVVAPGPGHSRADRSLSIKIDATAPDGFRCHSFAGDDWRACRDHVRAALGLVAGGRWRQQSSASSLRPFTAAPDKDAARRSALALRYWREGRDPRGTVVATYLGSRGLTLPDDIAGEVIRFHPALKFDGMLVGGMVALFRDLRRTRRAGFKELFSTTAAPSWAARCSGAPAVRRSSSMQTKT